MLWGFTWSLHLLSKYWVIGKGLDYVMMLWTLIYVELTILHDVGFVLYMTWFKSNVFIDLYGFSDVHESFQCKLEWFEQMSSLAWFQILYVHILILSRSVVLTHCFMFTTKCKVRPFNLLKAFEDYFYISQVFGRSSLSEDDDTIKLLMLF